MTTVEERLARVEGEQSGIIKRLDDMNSRLNILTAAIIAQTIATVGMIASVLLAG